MKPLLLLLVFVCAINAADISTEADLRAAILLGTGAHALIADVTLSDSLPSLPAGSVFSLNGGNHFISGDGKYSLFKCPGDATVLTLENLTLKNGYTSEHGAAVSSGQGIVVQRDIPGYGVLPIVIDGSKTNRVIIRNCVIRDNVSAKSGGAIFVHLEGEPGQPYLLIENCAIINNKVLKGPSIPTYQVNAEYNNGGAIWERVQSYQSDVLIKNSTLSGNYAPESGGAILVGESAGPTRQEMAVKVFNCTIVNNDCGFAGGAFWDDHSLLLDHSIIYGNSVNKNTSANGANIAGPGPSLTIRWSDIGSRKDENGVSIEQRVQYPVKGYASIWEGNNLSADPNLSALPVLIAARGASGTAYDTYLHVFDRSSPVYNAGDPGLVMGQGTTLAWDQRGDPKKRIEYGRIDIGSYELDTTVINSPPTISKLENVHILEDHTGQISFGFSDQETPPESLLVKLDRKQNDKIVFNQVAAGPGLQTITVRPDHDYNSSLDGPETLTVIVQDAQGASSKQTFTLEIDPVNDKPSLRGGADTISDSPGVTLTHDFGFLGRADRGDDTTVGLESKQIISFHLYDVSRNDFFQSLTIDEGSGAVTFTPRAGLTDIDSVRVRFFLKDDGGTQNNGIDSSDLYSFYVIIRKKIVPPAILQISWPGLVSIAPMKSPFPWPNSVFLLDPIQSDACLNCSGTMMDNAIRLIAGAEVTPGFHPYLLSLKLNQPVRYKLEFFSTLGEFINQAAGEIDERILRGMKMDGQGNYTVNMYWWPVSQAGQQAATGSYIVRGSISTTDGTEPVDKTAGGGSPLIRQKNISSIFGYLRR